ncbi:MAG: DUF2520 domain-containing protein [Flavobacteriaceae bacterium]|nr:DUF2520 domain-containing protein [Flavobacteriaceae bacterium]
MITVLIVGTGNVGFHLFNAFSASKTINVTQVSSRKLNDLPKADVTILAVSDDAIVEVSKKIKNSFVVHVSGSKSINELNNKTNKGVFYMLQTFSKEKPIDFNKVPFCLEAQNDDDFKLLENLAKSLGEQIYNINSEKRKVLHVAAVFANNFTNHMYKIAKDICDKHDISFKVLLPLINETSLKINYLDPKESQTGPAIRNDEKTILNHLTLLSENQKEIYKILTKSIQNGN